MIRRLWRFAQGNYPLAVFLPLTILWGTGLTGLFGVAHRQGQATWTPVGGILVTVLTLFFGIFVFRALDDIRDLEYDRVHSPQRPLPAGLVRTRDLITAIAAGTAGLLLLNAWRGIGVVLLAAVFGYTLLLVTVNIRFKWPRTENLLVHLVFNAPIQLLLSLYVYAAFLADHDLAGSPSGVAAAVTAFFVVMHLEFARKTTRGPGRTERTYVHHVGLAGTITLALVSAATAMGLALVATRPADPTSPAYLWGWLVLAPGLLPLLAAGRFVVRRARRWPPLGPLQFAVASYLSFLLIGFVQEGM